MTQTIRPSTGGNGAAAGWPPCPAGPAPLPDPVRGDFQAGRLPGRSNSGRSGGGSGVPPRNTLLFGAAASEGRLKDALATGN